MGAFRSVSSHLAAVSRLCLLRARLACCLRFCPTGARTSRRGTERAPRMTTKPTHNHPHLHFATASRGHHLVGVRMIRHLLLSTHTSKVAFRLTCLLKKYDYVRTTPKSRGGWLSWSLFFLAPRPCLQLSLIAAVRRAEHSFWGGFRERR